MRTGAVCLGILVAGCGGNDLGGPRGLTTFPTAANTGVDEGGGYVVPVLAMGATGLTWSSSDVSRVSIMGDDHKGMITAMRAGTALVEVHAANGQTSSLPVTVAQYTVAAKQAGQAAYQRLGCGKSGCHDATGPDVTSSGITEHNDYHVYYAITMGTNPEGGIIQSPEQPHAYMLNGSENMGIVAYLRSLPPLRDPFMDH